MQTLEQKRAADAWKKATEGVNQYGTEYINEAKGMPSLIMNNGLMQVMAFLNGKKQERSVMLASHLREWLHIQCGTPKDFNQFMNELFNLNDSREYQNLTAESLAWLKWLRQIAPTVQKH